MSWSNIATCARFLYLCSGRGGEPAAADQQLRGGDPPRPAGPAARSGGDRRRPQDQAPGFLPALLPVQVPLRHWDRWQRLPAQLLQPQEEWHRGWDPFDRVHKVSHHQALTPSSGTCSSCLQLQTFSWLMVVHVVHALTHGNKLQRISLCSTIPVLLPLCREPKMIRKQSNWYTVVVLRLERNTVPWTWENKDHSYRNASR